MEKPIHLAIINEDRLLRDCLASVLTEDKGFKVTCLPAEHLLALVPAGTEGPDVVLIDSGLTCYNALELTAHASLKFPRAKLVISGLEKAEESFLRFLEAGASGYLLRGESLEDLTAVVRLVHRGESVCSPRAAFSVFSRVAELAHDHFARQGAETSRLTSREMEILEFMAGGLSNKQIAARLDKSLYTVKNHVHNILGKLQTHDRQDAIRCAYKAGIIRRFQEPQEAPGPYTTTQPARDDERVRPPVGTDSASD
jgi:DNA-binding NarL/FixJ family response regulator